LSSQPSVQDQIDQGPVSAAQFLIVLTALLLNMLDGFDVSALAFTVHRIGDDMGIAADQLGLVFSVALAGMMAGAMFLAPLADILGRRRTIILSVCVIAASTLLTAACENLWQLLPVRAMTGLGVGAMLASLTTISAEYVPSKYRSLAVVCITAGYPLGSTVGGAIAAPLMANYGWQSVFLLAGSATALMLIPVLLLIPESLEYLARKQPPGALDTINKTLRRVQKEPLHALPTSNDIIERANVLSLLTAERRLKTLTLWASVFFCLICLYFLLSWIPKLVISSGLPEATGVYASMAFTAGSTVGTVILGLLAARFGLSLIIAVFLSSASLWMVVFALNADSLNLLFSLGLLGFLFASGYTGLYAVAAKIYPTDVRATGVGWAIGLGRFGAVVGPYVGGILIAAGVSMEVNFIIFAIPIMLGGIMAWRLRVN
jgi:AAHS family 4-hydroxybenzoate transporter-like MFS transporter